ncbi:MAG: adenylate kinase [Pyramidobacter sp.]|nr:adenylate kinase [Pyramidobacter sp.]
MRVILVGPPGAGKGTQAEKIVAKYDVAHISTGDILRANVKAGTELGKKAKSYMDAGGLVPDDVIVGMMRGRLAEDDCKNGFILDGFPRTVPQAEALTELLAEMGLKLDGVILLDVDDDTVVERLCGRRMCKKCGRIFHVTFKPSSKGDLCDECGGELYQRDDDKESVIRQRLAVYHSQTAPLVDYYGKAGLLLRVPGAEAGDKVLSHIEAMLGRRA